MEQKKNNGVNTNLNKPKELRESETQKPRTERHIFTLDVKFSIIAPPDVDRKTLSDKIEDLVDTYLHVHYAVSNITMPGRPGIPAAGTIIELKHKEK